MLRRLGAVPAGTPDGRGEDAVLSGRGIAGAVMVYFPDTETNLYQLRQWYTPLQALHRVHGVAIVLQDSRVARRVRAEIDLPVHVLARSAGLDAVVARSDLRLALYVSHLTRNFVALRHTTLVHTYLGHGESDKGTSASNQVKAYDFCFVAGQAAVDRIAQSVPLYDTDSRLVKIGRPQLDSGVTGPKAPTGTGLPTVLYAPTWEGAQPSVAYGSVATHGESLVGSLLRSGRFHVVYRPHPRTGANDGVYGAAHEEICSAVTAAARESEVPHRVDTSDDAMTAMREADIMITDVSAMALDWLPTGRPLLVTEPASPHAVVSGTALLDLLPRLTVDEAPQVAEVVAGLLDQDDGAYERAQLVDYYFGDVAPGRSTAAFLEACTRAIETRDREMARLDAVRGQSGLAQ